MMLRNIATALAIVIAIAAPNPVTASSSRDLSVADLHTPEAAVKFVVNLQKDAYEDVLEQYRRAQRGNPKDPSLALAQCKFISSFAEAEDLDWSDIAGKDFEACSSSLGKRFAGDPEVELFNLDRHFGAGAIRYGAPLIALSGNWSTVQRARLHAGLSRAYLATKDSMRSGQEAVLAAQLDPGNERLNEAIRYLSRTGHVQDAVKLLAAAPVSKVQWWQEISRFNTAAEVLPGTAARDELRRAQDAGIKVDAYTTARALQRADDSSGAQAALAANTTPYKLEIPKNRQLRLDVAFDAGDAKAAGDVLRDEFLLTGSAAPLTSAYAHLIKLDPAIAARVDLLPIGGALLVMLVLYAASPGLLLFPTHYRGTVRQRIGKVSTPLFERIGLRHAWYALAVFFLALYAVAMFRQGTAVLSPTGSGVARIGDTDRVAVSHLWMLFFSAAGLLPVARRLGWREWLGRERWKLSWMLVALVPFCMALLTYLLTRHARLPQGEPSTPWAVNLVHSAIAIGGIPLAVAVLCVFVPVIEELVFRGCLLGGLTRHISFGWANVLQAMLFASMHQDGKRFFYLFVFGLTAGWLARKSKALAMPTVFHAFNNGLFVFSIVMAGAAQR